MKYSVFHTDEHLLKEAYHGPSLPTAWEAELKQGDWYRIFLPYELNGLQLSLADGLEVLIETASLQGSLGWRVNLGAGAAYFAGSMLPDTAHKVYASQGALVAGSGAIKGKVAYSGSDWLISGSWPFCTGALSATAFTFNAKLPSGSVKTFVLRPEQVEVIKEWKYFALKATQTYTVRASSSLVPESMSFVIDGACHFPDYALYRLGFEPFARFCMAASVIGLTFCVARHAGYFHDQRHVSDESWLTASRELFDIATVFRDFLLSEANAVYGRYYTDDALQQLVKNISVHITKVEQQSIRLFQQGGMEACNEDILFHQALRDLWLALRHFLLKA
ncbi:MAG: hypothetical protein NZM13_10620 [Cyclobacteriaceae bacterium]|nr:hypothetical protein [Cyclobacteriaceae bacterium]MDW8332364.1 hypothetical protein [Cyclobacteriaceae bacterium]